MREIKFRGKSIDTGEWVYGYYVRYEHLGNVKHIIVTDWAQVYVNSYYVILESVGQFTGLHDKNGTEIYEGDIVVFDCYSYEEPENTYTGEVVYSNGNACFCLNGNDGCGEVDCIPLCEIGGSYTTIIEVIGNIFENPELLESGE